MKNAITTGLIFFVIAFINLRWNQAATFGEMGLVGKGAVVGFCICLLYIVVINIRGLFKKKKSND